MLYSYLGYAIQISILHLYNRDLATTQLSFMWCTISTQLCIFCWLLKLYYCELLLEKPILISYQLNIDDVAKACAVISVYYGHLAAIHKCPDHQGLLITWVNLYAKALFWTITKCVDSTGVLIIKCLIYRFPCISIHEMKLICQSRQ